MHGSIWVKHHFVQVVVCFAPPEVNYVVRKQTASERLTEVQAQNKGRRGVNGASGNGLHLITYWLLSLQLYVGWKTKPAHGWAGSVCGWELCTNSLHDWTSPFGSLVEDVSPFWRHKEFDYDDAAGEAVVNVRPRHCKLWQQWPLPDSFEDVFHWSFGSDCLIRNSIPALRRLCVYTHKCALE